MGAQRSCPRGHVWESGDESCPVCAAATLPGLVPPPPAPGATADVRQDSTQVSPPLAAPACWSEGPVIPGYEVLSELGRGGMGVVFKARQVALNRVVALKMIQPGPAPDREVLARFHVEATLLARLSHPNVVQVHEVGTVAGLPYLVLEYVEGGTLARLLGGTPQEPRRAAQWLLALARAVHFAHEHGILHRDLKPANVLVSAEGTLKVTDFGLARQLEPEPAGGLTATGQIMGTPGYMAPEQAGGVARQLTPAVDIHALGAILYEMLTGRPPFLAASLMDALLRVLREDAVPVRRLAPRVPRDLETICHRCLQKEPARRYASAALLADDLERFLKGEPIRARPVGRLERLLKWTRRRPAAAALVAVIVCAAALGLAGVLMHQVQLQRKNDELHEALARETRQRDRNAELLRISMDVMGHYGSLVDEQVAALPELRRKLAEKRLPFYEPFLKQAGDDPEVRYRHALALMEIGLIRWRMGDDKRGDLEQARQHFARSAALWDGLRRDFPADPQYRRRAAALEVNCGLLSLQRGRGADAERHFRQGLSLLQPLEPLEQGDVVRCLFYLTLIALETGRLDEADALAGRQVRLLEQLRAQEPRRAKLSGELGAALSQHGEVHRQRSRPALFVAPAGPAQQPAVWANLARVHLARAHQRRALTLFRRALPPLTDAIRRDPPALEAAQRLRFTGLCLLELAGNLGDAEGLLASSTALRTAADALAGVDPPGGMAYVVAAVPAARSIGLLPAAERSGRGDRAVELLRAARTRGYRDARALRSYPAFRALRGRADFEALLAEMEKKGGL